MTEGSRVRTKLCFGISLENLNSSYFEFKIGVFMIKPATEFVRIDQLKSQAQNNLPNF